MLNKCLNSTDTDLASEIDINLGCTYDNLRSNSNLDWSYFNRGLVEERRLHFKLGSLVSDSLSVDVRHDDVQVLSIGVLHIDAGQSLLTLKLRGNAVSISTAAEHGSRVELRL